MSERPKLGRRNELANVHLWVLTAKLNELAQLFMFVLFGAFGIADDP